jgi:hypothetical protein
MPQYRGVSLIRVSSSTFLCGKPVVGPRFRCRVNNKIFRGTEEEVKTKIDGELDPSKKPAVVKS